MAFILGLLCGAIVTLIVSSIISTVQYSINQVKPTASATPTDSADDSADDVTLSQLARRDPDDVAALGDPQAPLTIIEYADFRCPFCSAFTSQTLPQIRSTYVDTGLVRFEFRDMPVFGDQSVRTAVASRAAGKQGVYWEFSTAVAINGVNEGGHPDLTDDRLVEFASQAGVSDLDAFRADLDDADLLAEVQRDYAEGQTLGVSSVPAFIIGDQAVMGAQPFETFAQIIEQELDALGVER